MKTAISCCICLFCLSLIIATNAHAGNALEFDRDQFLEVFIPNSESVDIHDNTITIECWIITPDPGDAPAQIIAAKGGGPDSGTWKIRVSPEGMFQVRFMINNEGSGWFGDGFLEANEWTHVAVTYDGERINTYINGEEISSDALNGNIDASNEPLRFGRRNADDANFFTGIIDEFRLWDIARSQEDLQASMNSMISGETEGLVGYWRMDEGEGQIVHDETGNNNNGRMGLEDDEDARDPRWVESDAPIFGGLIQLDRQEIRFGPVAIGQNPEIRITMANLSEEEEDHFQVHYLFQHENEAPDWLAIEPMQGDIRPREEAEIVFTAVTEDVELGDYDHSILLTMNAMNVQRLMIPVSMSLVSGTGNLEGVVLDHATNAPVQGAIIRALGDYDLYRISDDQGRFEFIDLPACRYVFEVTAQDYLPLITEEIAIEDNGEEALELRLLYAELIPRPLRVEFSMQSDDELEVPLMVHNSGNGPLTWSMEKAFEGGGGIDPWVFRGGFAAGDSVGDNRMAGIEFVGGNFYLAGGTDRADQSMIYIFDRDGNHLDQFPQFAETRYGMRDLAYDGSLLWGVDGNTIYGFTTDGNLIHELDSPVNSARYIAYDPDRRALWVSSVTTDIEGISLDGEEIGELSRPPDTHIYGLSWFPEDADGYHLYVFTNDGDYHQQVHKVNPDTDESMCVRDLIDVEGARAGGLAISGTWDPYSWVFMSMLDSPDMVAIWQLAPRTNWLDAAPVEGVVEPDGDLELTISFNSLGLPIDEEFEADLVFTHDGIGGETVVPVSLLITDVGGISQRIIRLALGWNMVSVNVIPPEDSVEVIMRPLVEEDLLLLMKDGDGHFYNPAFGYNGIPGWNVAEGYQVKVCRDCELVVDGEVIAWDMPIALSDGWQIVSYYPRVAVDAMVALRGIEEYLLLAKDASGHFYYPELGFSNIGNMVECQGYQLKLDGERELVYRLDEGAANQGVDLSGVPVHFGVVNSTGSNMSLLVLADETYAGCELGVLNLDGRLIGSGVFNAAGRCGVAVWGDDPTTDEVDGMRFGEALDLRLFDCSKRIERNVQVKDILTESGLVFQADGFSAATITNTPAVPQEYYLSSVYPNPFNNSTRLTFSLPEASLVELIVFDLAGRVVGELIDGRKASGIHTLMWDASTQPSGIYLARLITPMGTQTVKMTLVR